MQVVLRRVLLVLSTLLLVSGVGATAPQADSVVAVKPPSSVYVLRGGDAATDTAVVNALRAAGMDVTTGVETPEFSGSEANLPDFDAVLVLYNQNVARVLAPAGVAALVEYVQAGGGLVSSEWLIWQSAAQNYTALSDILPATSCGIQTAGSTTLTQLTPNPVISAGLPVQFSLPLGNFSGSQGCLIARPEAAALYANSYPGRDDAVGLAAWNPPTGSGRVASFATLLSAAEVATGEGQTLLQNTVAWVAGGHDLTPPTIQEFTVAGAAQSAAAAI
ncbi:MAG: ThuA domain-containing protein [Oscillochloris sp.]|nr:ThuA domain-containing protein [Oscillochloris sp.]